MNNSKGQVCHETSKEWKKTCKNIRKKKKKDSERRKTDQMWERQAANKSLQTVHVLNARAPRNSLAPLCSHDFQKGYLCSLRRAFLPQLRVQVQIFFVLVFQHEGNCFFSFNLRGFHPVNLLRLVSPLNLNSDRFQTGIRQSFVTLLFWYLLIFIFSLKNLLKFSDQLS